MTDRPYTVVTFLPNDVDTEPTSDVIPTCWLFAQNTKAYWPNFCKSGNTDKRSKLILSLAEPDKNWPIYDVKYCHSYDTYNKARKAANLQNDEDRTVGTEVSDIDHRRKRKKNPKYISESSEDEGNLRYKRKRTSNQLLSDDSENEEMQKDLQVKVAALLSKKNNRKPKVSQDKEVSMVIKYKDVKKAHDSNKDCSVDLNNTIESQLFTKTVHKQTSAIPKRAAIDTITSISLPSASNVPLQFYRQYDDEDTVEEQLLSGNNVHQSEPVIPFSTVKQIVQKKSGETINAATDVSETMSQKLSQSAYSNNEHSENKTIPKEHSKENRSRDANCNNSFGKLICPSKNQLSDNTIATETIKAELFQEISSKLDFLMMNTTKILTHLAPEENLLVRPDNLPALPLKSVDEYEEFEGFLNNSTNFSAMVQYPDSTMNS